MLIRTLSSTIHSATTLLLVVCVISLLALLPLRTAHSTGETSFGSSKHARAINEPLVNGRQTAALLDPAQSASQWRALAPLEGGTIFTLASEGGRIYAGTSGRGVFLSTDNGKTWRASGNNLSTVTINNLLAVGKAVIAATSSGVFYTDDGGQRWNNTLANVSLVALAQSESTLYAGSAAGRVFRSTDNGLSWQERGSPGGGRINAIVSKDGALFAGLAGGAVLGVFRSADQGQTWRALTSGLPNNGTPAVFALTLNSNALYVGTLFYSNNQPQVYGSLDNGESWFPVGSSSIGFNVGSSTSPVSLLTNVQGFAADGNAQPYPLALCQGGIASFNGDWSEYLSNRGLPMGSTVYALLRTEQATLLGTSGGLFALSADRLSWTPSQTGLTAAAMTALAANNNVLVASAGDSGFFRSTNDGQNWLPMTTLNLNGRPYNVRRLLARGNDLLAGTAYGGAYFSSDNGTTWTAVNRGLALTSASTITDLAVSGNDVYALSFSIVHKLAADSGSWTQLNGGRSLTPTPARLAANGVYLFAGTTTNLLRSTDSGANFNPANLGATPVGAFKVAARGNNVYYSYSANNVGNIAVSTDNGASFVRAQTGLFVNDFAFNGDVLYAASSTGIFYSTNNGNNWSPINAGLPFSNITSLAMRGNLLFAGTTGHGVFAATNPHLQPANLANTSAASFSANEIAAETIVAAFGANLATTTQAASSVPLPISLGGTRLTVRDSAGVERNAPLFFVSPSQVNYQLPPGTAAGKAVVFMLSGLNESSFGEINVARVAPGLFSANGNGQGVAAAVALRVRTDGSQSFEPVAQFDANANRFVPIPIDLGASTEQAVLLLFGTGIRGRSNLSAVTCRIGGVETPVSFVGAQGDLVGLDQINVGPLPRALAGRGEVDLVLTADGKAANTVKVSIK
ncbi:MAG: hypothetical protein HYR56_21135 [Acidobacteria bacterium]|nr:hypothetical protein [Acidobacteriota bacterium]MBI3428110.1 hypothetical protein [Acidobacteriota bacterium]